MEQIKKDRVFNLKTLIFGMAGVFNEREDIIYEGKSKQLIILSPVILPEDWTLHS